MRYFEITYADNPDNNTTEIWSEEDIRNQYYPHWYEKMCEKYGKEYVDENYSFQDCVEDWMIVNWAMEVTAVNSDGS